MKIYPIFIDLEGQRVVVIGGGQVALQKLKNLVSVCDEIIVISKDFSDETLCFCEQNQIQITRRAYQRGDLEGARLVFAATNSRLVNRVIHEDAQELGILFNAVDQPEECDFIVPAQVKRGPLTIAVSTSGEAPFLAKKLRERLEKQFGPEYAILTALFGVLRRALKHQQQNQALFFLEENFEEILHKIQSNKLDSLKNFLIEKLGAYGVYAIHTSCTLAGLGLDRNADHFLRDFFSSLCSRNDP